MIRESIKKLFSFFSELWRIDVEEGGMFPPFYRKVYYKGNGRSVFALMGIHLIHRLYVHIAYIWFRDANLVLLTVKERNDLYSKGREDQAELDRKIYGMSFEEVGKKKNKINKL